MTGKIVRVRPAKMEDMDGFFEYYSTIIPSKHETNELGSARLGIVDVPSGGLLILFSAHLRGEAIIKLLGSVPTAPDCSAKEALVSRRDELLEFQDETFQEFRALIQAEIKGSK